MSVILFDSTLIDPAGRNRYNFNMFNTILDAILFIAGSGLLVYMIFLSKDTTPAEESQAGAAEPGYDEFSGTALERMPLQTPFTKTPCVCYTHKITEQYYERGYQHERTVESDQSSASFYLEDTTGRILVCPRGAEYLLDASTSEQEGERKHTEHFLSPGEQVFVKGTVAPLDAEEADIEKTLADKQGRVPCTMMIIKSDDGPLVVSCRSEEDTESYFDMRRAITLGIAMLAAAAGLMSLLAHMGVLPHTMEFNWDVWIR
jgi:hypothetical protein